MPFLTKQVDREIRHLNSDEKDWYFISVQDSTLRMAGDETKLVQCISDVLSYFDLSETEKFDDFFAHLVFLQTWYTNQCDGDWEHTYGIRARVDASGYCQCTIDLYGIWRYLDEQNFEAIGTRETFYSHKAGEQLVREGKVECITLFLKAFKDWVESIHCS